MTPPMIARANLKGPRGVGGASKALYASEEMQEPESKKLSKAVVLYMPGKVLGSNVGAHCGDCWKFAGSESGPGECIEVEGDINPAHGVCGLYVNGRVFDGVKPNLPAYPKKVSKKIAGYVEQGPTHCGNCDEKLGGDAAVSECKKVEGEIEFFGCCNRWEEKGEHA